GSPGALAGLSGGHYTGGLLHRFFPLTAAGRPVKRDAVEHRPAEGPAAPPGGAWDAGLYDDKHSFVWKHGASLVELLAPPAGQSVLDVGGGTGPLPAQRAERGADVLGIDNPPAMIEQARRAYPRLRFEAADARDFTFPEPFDAVFSNAVLHWVTEPGRVVAC